MSDRLKQGAVPSAQGVRYTTWAPQRERVQVEIVRENGERVREVSLARVGEGFHTGMDVAGRVGDLYFYSFGENGRTPDIVSRFQPQGVEGPSMVVDLEAYRWKQVPWCRSSLEHLVIYELHVGTFSSEGTFAAAEGKLPHLKRLGVT